uniref:TPD52 like 2 n=1 Tax=Leptobrachium leishanense TaxID=445787 RepID=A0A8C5WJG8_9ANUR
MEPVKPFYINLNSPNKGLLPDTMTDVPVGPAGSQVPADAAGAALPEGMTEAEAEELRIELAKVEEEISTLRHVLSAKERHLAELKRKMGQTPLNQLKMNLSKSLQEVQMSNAYVKTTEKIGEWNEIVTQSDVYKKTSETLSQAGQKTTAALSNVGTAISRRLGDMSDSMQSHAPSPFLMYGLRPVFQLVNPSNRMLGAGETVHSLYRAWTGENVYIFG